MAHLIKPTQEARLHRIISNTSKLDRLRFREVEKTVLERQFMMPKMSAMPALQPSMKREPDAKCYRCDVAKETFTRHDDWYMEPIDALQMHVKREQNGFFDGVKAAVFRRFLSLLMDSLVIHPAHIERMKNIQREKPNFPLVFVMNSKHSQLDILMVIFILYLNDIKLPLVIADEKLNDIPIAGRILQSWNVNGNEKLNESQVAAHLHAKGNVLVVLDNNDESELELILNACGFGSSVEIFLLPISINYEKHPGESSLILYNENLGIVKVNFHEPYVVGDLVDIKELFEMKSEQQTSLMLRIRDHLKYDIIRKKPIMSSNIVAFLLLTHCRDGALIKDLAIELDEFRKEMRLLDFAFEGDAVDIVERGIEILGKELVTIDGDMIKTTSNVVQVFNYAETIVPHLMMQSIIVIAFHTIKKHKNYVDFKDLIETSFELCKHLQGGIQLVKPCDDLNSELLVAFDKCSIRGILHKPMMKATTANEERARRMAYHFEDVDDSDDDNNNQSRNMYNEVKVNCEKVEQFEALKNVAMPIADAYFTVVFKLKELVNCRIPEKTFVAMAIKAMREECEDGNSKYWESINEKLMRISLKCLKIRNIIEFDRSEDALINIHPDFDRSKAIKSIINEIDKFI